MAFKLAEAFVEIGVSDKALKSGLASAKAGIENLRPAFDRLSSMARKSFAGLVGLGALFVKSAADSSDAADDLRIAVGGNVDGLRHYAEALQKITIYSHDEIEAGMAVAARAGVQADELQQVSKVAIGLATMLHTDLAAGYEAVSHAMMGNTRELDRQIPGLKQLTTGEAKLAAIQEYAMHGFDEAQQKTKTVSGSLKQLWNTVFDLSEMIGEQLLPYVRNAILFFKQVGDILKNLSAAQVHQIILWGEIAAGVALVIGFGPMVADFATIAVKAFMGIAQAILGLGKILLWIVTSPIGLILLGVAAVATGFVLLAGDGDTMKERLVNSFKSIVSFLDIMFGSWKGFTTGIKVLWTEATLWIAEGLTILQNYLSDGYEFLGEMIEQIWWAAFEYMYEAWNYMKTGALRFMNWLHNAWQASVDFLADAFTGVKVAIDFADTEKQIRKMYQKRVKDKKMSQEQVDAIVEKERAATYASMDKMADAAKTKRSDAYNAKQKQILDDSNLDQKAMKKQIELVKESDYQKRQSNMDANDVQARATVQLIRNDRIKASETMANMPKLSSRMTGVMDAVKGVFSLKEFDKIIDELKKAVKGKPPELPNPLAEEPGLRMTTGSKTQMKRQDISETFKNFQAMKLMGIRGATPEQMQRQALSEARKTNVYLEKALAVSQQIAKCFPMVPVFQ